MATFEAAVPIILADEGGLSNNVSDPGGLTKYGISQKAYPNLDIANLTLGAAEQIWKNDYWRFDLVDSQSIANKLVDMSVNLGLPRTVELLQTAINTIGGNVTVDGVWGPNTLYATNTFPAPELLSELRTEQQTWYVHLAAVNPNDYQFLKGWLRRANNV